MEKGYPKNLITEAYNRAKKSSQMEYLTPLEKPESTPSTQERPIERVNFVTTYNKSHKDIRKILQKNWFILKRDPYLKDIIAAQPNITFRRAPTLKNLLAPSKLKKHTKGPNMTYNGNIGSYKCQISRCLCCNEIEHKKISFKSNKNGETHNIKYHLDCSSQYVIYLLECCCNKQYVGRTIQKLRCRITKHRANIRNAIMQHSVSRHISQYHQGEKHPFTVTPIDWVSTSFSNRFQILQRREMYWIFKLQTLVPNGLNEITELIQ